MTRSLRAVCQFLAAPSLVLALTAAPLAASSTAYVSVCCNAPSTASVFNASTLTQSRSLVTGSGGDGIAVTPLRIQETVNAIRAIAEIVRLMPDNEQDAMVLRAEPFRVALADWLVHQMDQETVPASTTQEYHIPPGSYPGNNNVARVFFLAHTSSSQGLQGVLSKVKKTTGIERLMPYPALHAVVLRSTDAGVAQAAQLIQQLDTGQ